MSDLQNAVELQKQLDADVSHSGLMPEPPEGFPAIPAANHGSGPFSSGHVVGYKVAKSKIVDWKFNGEIRKPGDAGFYEAIMAYLTEGKRLLPGWSRTEREGVELFAITTGNACIIESEAYDLSPLYKHAVAINPNCVRLAEVPNA